MTRPRTLALGLALLVVTLAAGTAAAQKRGKQAPAANSGVVMGGVLGGTGSEAPPTQRDYRACERGKAWSCMSIGDWLVSVGRDGAPYHERACKKGALYGCYKAGDAYRHGARRDLPRAGRLLALGCNGGEDLSCYGLANLLMDLGTPDARRRALKVMTHACQLSYTPGC